MRAWTGPVLLLLGSVALAWQAYAWVTSGVLFALLCGGGIGLIFLGAAKCLDYFDDRGAPQLPRADEKMPTAEEYERSFQETDKQP